MSTTDTIGREFRTSELARFVAPPVITRFALSLLQTLDDGLFISRFVGINALAAFSIGSPIFMTIWGLGEIFNGVGVLCATQMGEKKKEEACSNFTTVVIFAAAFGLTLSILFRIFLDRVIWFMGATELLFPYLKDYMGTMLWNIPLIFVRMLFARFYVPAGKPSYSMVTTLMDAGCNFFLDWLFIVKMQLGMQGAALANIMAAVVTITFGLIFYSSDRCEIGFARPNRNIGWLLGRCAKFGSPQFLTMLAISVNSYIANRMLLHYSGETAVSAFTIINNVQFMFMSLFFGLSEATSPLVSYAFGEGNSRKLARILKQVMIMTTGVIVIVTVSYLFGKNFALTLYLKSDAGPEVRQMAALGLRIAPLGFMFYGYNVLTIDTFVALNDNRTSTLLTTLENVVFANLTIFLLPELFGLTGIWFAFPVAEILTFVFTVTLILLNRKKYLCEHNE